MTILQPALAEINNTKDPVFLDWLDLYETSFPSNERMLVSDIIRTLDHTGTNDEHASTHFLALLDESKSCIGIMLYYANDEDKTAWLWYMAISPKVQSKGLGSYLYQELVKVLDSRKYKALFLEVEIPDKGNSIQAERRIHFYERQGASLLKNIDYMQDIGWHTQPTPLFLMVHCFQPLDAVQIFELAKKMFGDAVSNNKTKNMK